GVCAGAGRLHVDRPGGVRRPGQPRLPAAGAALRGAGGYALVAGGALARPWLGRRGLAGCDRRGRAGRVRDLPRYRWRGLSLPAPIRRGVLLRLRLSRAAAVPARRLPGHSGERDHPRDDRGQRADAAARRGQRRGHGRGRRCLAQGPDRERAGMAAGLAAGRVVPAARGLVATRSREAGAGVTGSGSEPRYARAWAMIAAAFAALSRTLFHSPATSQSLGTIHEPPMQSTFGCARNSPALASLM